MNFVIAMPVSVYSSRVTLGRAARRARLFLIPEEADPPGELRTVRVHAERAEPLPGFVDVVVDPHLNAIARAATPRYPRAFDRMHGRRSRTISLAVERGPDALSEAQKHLVLADSVILSELHRQVTSSSAAHPSWRVPRSGETVGEGAAVAAAL